MRKIIVLDHISLGESYKPRADRKKILVVALCTVVGYAHILMRLSERL